MSAANSARPQVRDDAPQTPPQTSHQTSHQTSAAVRAPQAAASSAKKRAVFGFAGANTEDHFKLNLNDIPQLPRTMDIEGLKPSLLARLFGLVMRS